MKIDETEFGSITIAGKTYEHDVVIRLSDKVVKRKKKLSRVSPTSPWRWGNHVLTKLQAG